LQGLGTGWVEILTALHDERGVADGSVFKDTNGRKTVGTAAVREGGVAEGEADVEGNDRIEAEGFIHCVLFCVRFFFGARLEKW
jgi:hypothetical protein